MNTTESVIVDPELQILSAGNEPALDADPVRESGTAPESAPAPVAEADPTPSRAKRIAKASVFWLVLILIGLAIWWMGLTAATVKTGSMRPGIQPGDLVVGVSTKIVKPQVGSIVIAEPVVAGKELPAIAHRVIAINPDGTIKTQGDFNPEPDAWTDTPEMISKVVLFKIPMGWTRNPATVAAGLGVLALVFMWPSSKKKDEESDEVEVADTQAAGDNPQDEPELDLREPHEHHPIKV